MADFEQPSNPDAVTPAWLDGVLRSSGVLTRSRVIACDVERIGVCDGLTGQLARLTLGLDNEESGVPSTLIVKFPTADLYLRSLLHRFRMFEREIRFYEQLAPKIELRTPRCYFSSLDRASGDNVLVLEDLSNLQVGDNLAGCCRENAELALTELAHFHAGFWDHASLREMDWIPQVDEHADAAQSLYLHLWELFQGKFGERLPASFVEYGTRYGAMVARTSRALAQAPCTVVHGDFRLSNVLFSKNGGSASLAVIDWQMIIRGRATLDVAYFLVSCLPAERRREWERPLLGSFHAALMEQGVEDYSWDRCLEDYRRSVLHILFRVVTAGALLDLSSGRSQELTAAVAERCCAAFVDNEVDEFLGPQRGAVNGSSPGLV